MPLRIATFLMLAAVLGGAGCRAETPDCRSFADRDPPHQAPDLEALLPKSVSGRQLAVWSVRGRCWLEMTVGGDAKIETLLAEIESAGDGQTMDVARIGYGVAGRQDQDKDPPYFVFVASRTNVEDEILLATVLLFGGAQFHDPLAARFLTGYEERTIGGKAVWVGSNDMLAQSDHQRGAPYLYQTWDQMFLVVTEDEAWAADALSQLP